MKRLKCCISVSCSLRVFSYSSLQARSPTEFGDSWVVNPDQCGDVDPGPTDPCDEGLANTREEAADLCNYLLDPSGKYLQVIFELYTFVRFILLG